MATRTRKGFTSNGKSIQFDAHEIAFADEIFAKTGRRCIVPDGNLGGYEGFMDDGTPFTMKEPTTGDFTSFGPLLNDMYGMLKLNSKVPWTNVEGYMKIPFTRFQRNDNSWQDVTVAYVQNQFKRFSFQQTNLLKNDGTFKAITVYLANGSTIQLDLTPFSLACCE